MQVLIKNNKHWVKKKKSILSGGKRHFLKKLILMINSAPCNVNKATMLALVSPSCGRFLSGHGGRDVCVADVTGCSEWSSFVKRKCPWPTLHAQRVGSFVSRHG